MHYQRWRRHGTYADSAVKKYGGNSFVDNKGYIRVWHNGRSKMQHRVVMEEYLGRDLEPCESVHHKNGDRQDNRLENLELWASSQPAGQRVKDLVAWAKEIIEKYGTE